MIELEENKHKLILLKEKLKSIEDALNITKLKEDLKTLEAETNKPGFWENSQNSGTTLTKMKKTQNKIENFEKIQNELENLESLNELLLQEEDIELGKEVLRNTKKIEEKIEKVELETLLSGKYDKNNAIITLHPGAGGTESQDWAEMLYRMYCKWAASNGFDVQELDYLEGDEAGIKSVTFLVKGENAYGYLKGENGVHRLVRISPFDSNKRRHTTFASVEVIPEFDTSINVEIKDDDLKIDVYRSSGAGGQSVNTTDSAVRITHIPTKIVVTCQNERSQLKNKEKAMQILKNKLYLLTLEKKEKEINSLRGTHMDINFGSQIRSYVMHPYSMVKDHRTNTEDTNVLSVLDGNIDKFIESFLRM